MGKKYQDEVELLITARNEARAELERADKEAQQQAREQARRADTEERQARQRAEVLAEIEQTALRRRGRVLQADLIQVRRHFAQRIAAAKEANDQELADRLVTLQKLREAEARSAEQRRRAASQQGRVAAARDNLLVGLGRVAAVAGAADAARGLIEGVTAVFRGEFEKAGEAFRSTPVFGAIVGLGQSLRELFLGEQREIDRLRKQTAELQAAQQRREGELSANRQLEEVIEQLQRQKVLGGDITELERERIQIAARRQQTEEQITKLLRERRNVGRAEAEREARDLADQIAQAELAKAREADAERERERLSQIRAVEDEAEILKLRRVGRVLDAELLAIQREFEARVEAANKAGDADLAKRLAVLRAEREAVARANEAQRREQERQQQAAERRQLRLQALDDQRRAADRDIADLTEQLRQARETARRQTATLPQADPGARFLTGVRERTQASDRAAANEANRQIAALEKQLDEMRQIKADIASLVDAVRNAPRVFVVDQI